MIDVEPLIRDRGEHLAPTPDGTTADWDDVLVRAALPSSDRATRRRPWRLAVSVVTAAVAAAAVVAVATPVGGAITQTVRDFSAWLRGEPGEPVTDAEQRTFDENNDRSWGAFPGSPKLRRLIRTEQDGVTFDLLGFRSGGALCIRIIAAGEADGSTLTCAPVADLDQDDAPVRVLLADWSVGRGDKKETIGFDTYTSPRAQVTAGIAADGVEAVELVDDQGTHRVGTESNAFLYVAERPEVGQRVTHVRAELESGETVGVPFAVSPWGPGGGFGGSGGEPGGPTKVERVVKGGRIGWVDRREERGTPVDDSITDKFRMLSDMEFARLLTPDEGSSKRVVIAVGQFGLRPAAAAGEMPARAGICYWLVGRGGLGGGCSPPDKVFERWPFTFGYSVTGGGDQFATFSGLASDDVSRLEIFTATGNQIAVPLRDNAFLAEVSLARLPAKMVAYDTEGRVIGIGETPRDQGSGRVVGEPVVELSATAAGVGTLKLKANRTREGGECWAARGTGDAAVNTGSCVPKDWQKIPLRLATLPDPAVFVYGRVRGDITTLILEFADGSEQEIAPQERGYVLHVLPEAQRRNGHELIAIIGRAGNGEVVARQSLKPG